MYRSRSNRKRSLFAIILLMVMLLQMGVKVLHQHHHDKTVEFYCSDCENHRVHDGHIIGWDDDSDDCQICQILAAPFVHSQEVHVSFCPVVNYVFGITEAPKIYESEWCRIAPRGPPSLL